MLKPLLTRGFLPRELPPLFSSISFELVCGKAGMPIDFTGAKAPWSQPLQHNLARTGGLRRKLTIPNPVNFYRLASAFDAHSVALAAEWTKSPFSKTTPDSLCKGPRAIVGIAPDRATARAETRVGARYLLKADISQFYPSIYSHSIPWVLHTKAVAKSKMKDLTLSGNILDREVQACQAGQTKGIAIGPDTSLGIAELLLAPLDKSLNESCAILSGTRFIDDIELTFKTLADADRALAELEALLNGIELQLNATKTRILTLPQGIESSFVSELRSHIPSATSAPPSQWIDYFNRAFSAAGENPQDGVLRYAISALQGVTVSKKSWGLVQKLLWQCIALDPGSLRFVVDVLLINKQTGGFGLDLIVGTNAINALIQTSASVGHGSEVVWSIWAAMILGLSIHTESQTAIADMDDAVVACASMIAKDKNFFDASLNSMLWKSWLVEDCFEQEHWLFVYEALRRGWFPHEVAASKIAASPNANFLLASGVTFIDEDAPAKYLPSRLSHVPGSGGEGAAY
ncbi:RNA-directed DNA polymerase [Variovorax sp. dw_308]|uniref:RNA-directed DNA polymerase n=1 Tax=Variovorax sp. dw_308 TaxID=2721546 RepID=UPI001C4853BF|nr:RNA-directed DNA polymerase [Variovorax sp. dw_308]